MRAEELGAALVAKSTASGRPHPQWLRPLAITSAVLFVVSCVFPLAAGLIRNTAVFPRWWGAVDVALAFFLAIPVLLIVTLVQKRVTESAKDATYRSYRILTHGILVFLVAFFLAGNRITWINCATGFGWRAWLLLYCLPYWFTAVENPRASSVPYSPKSSRQ